MDRVVAWLRRRPLASGACAVALWVLVVGLAWSGVRALRESRDEAAALRARASQPISQVPLLAGAHRAFRARDRSAAQQDMLSILRASAQREGLLIESIDAEVAAENGPILAARILVSGPEAAVLRFVGSVERGSPFIRLPAWRLANVSDRDAAVRLEARAVAVWGGGG